MADRKYSDTKQRRSCGQIVLCPKKSNEKPKKGADHMQVAVKATATEPARESRTVTRRIGSTDFEIAVFFSDKSKETLNDKIKRLIKSETGKGVKRK
jgi:hypothetical protein